MEDIRIIGKDCPNIPWQDKPEDYRYPVWRYSDNPITKINHTKSCARIFNSGIAPYKDGFVGIFRAEHRNGSPQLHIGMSKDGLNWDIDDDYIRFVDTEGKPFQPQYPYDPRLVEIDGVYYIMWCTHFYGPTIGLAKTTDFKTFIRLENAFLPYNRNGVLFPRKINGNYVMLSRPSDTSHTPFGDVFLSESPDLIYWGKHRHVMSKGGSGWWQCLKIGAGPIPIETNKGWLLFYHGVVNNCNCFVYSMGAALLDINTPSKVLYRTDGYLLTPELPYETVGNVPNVCFPCAAVYDAQTGRIAIYYGAADTYIAVAFTTVSEIYKNLLENNHLVNGDELEGRA